MTPQSIFEPDGDRFVPTALARGPWDREAQHGGAPSALLATLMEELLPESLVARFTVEFVRPAPLAPLEVRRTITRRGRQVQRSEAVMLAGDIEIARASALHLRRKPMSRSIDASHMARAHEVPPPGREAARPVANPPGADYPAFHNVGMEVLFARGAMIEAGPAVTWFRFSRPLLAGHPPSPVALAVAACDFTNGVSSVVPWSECTFINVDLTLYFNRMPEGEWVCLDAVTRAGPFGCGVAEAIIHDDDGVLGVGQQSVLFEERR